MRRCGHLSSKLVQKIQKTHGEIIASNGTNDDSANEIMKIDGSVDFPSAYIENSGFECLKNLLG